ncbi:hypothetical protein AB0436_22200 [Streptomyces sp. NPDC051322]|uniref:RcpC/CpaB family pilus assembly protein n=1 Tax=Streptomyces sp. NPDC051322 TaxID=3154645 RepID=UPI00345069B4
MIPMPVPVVSAPEPRGVPLFAPLRVPGGRQRLRRALRRRHRALSAGLVVTAAALVAWAPPDRGGPAAPDTPPAAHAARAAPGAAHRRPVVRSGVPGAGKAAVVSAPVRIADAATVRLLEPGDRVDVIAIGDLDRAPGAGGAPAGARVVATDVRVTGVPDVERASPPGGGGALIVLAVSRSTATALAGAAAHSDLAVTLC